MLNKAYFDKIYILSDIEVLDILLLLTAFSLLVMSLHGHLRHILLRVELLLIFMFFLLPLQRPTPSLNRIVLC